MKYILGMILSLFTQHSLAAVAPARMTLEDIDSKLSTAETLGSGKSAGTKTFFPVGDGKKAGLFTVIFKLPPNSQVDPHSHPDERSCFVLQGEWYIGYGKKFDEKELKHLPVGSHYTEPANTNHFAATKSGEVTVECTGIGPTGTTFIK